MKQTLQNLAAAFVGESQARNRYSMYAKIATKEGYERISEIFLRTAEHEREHAKGLFKMMNELMGNPGLKGGPIKVEAEVPTAIGTTPENLRASMGGESHEHMSMYPEFADTADKEGLPEIASRLRAIGRAEKYHEGLYAELLKDIEEGTVLKGRADTEWVCRKCGYSHTGDAPPEKCPSCLHPSNHFDKH